MYIFFNSTHALFTFLYFQLVEEFLFSKNKQTKRSYTVLCSLFLHTCSFGERLKAMLMKN